MFIESVAAGVIANVVYECTRKGVSLTKDFLVRELSKAVNDDQQKLVSIAEELVKLDQDEELEDLSEKGIIKRMQKYPELVNAINSINQRNVQNITNQNHYGNGDNVGGDKYC